jgi:hypothetical protein
MGQHRLVNIAQVDENVSSHRLPQLPEIDSPKLIPLGQHHEYVGALHSFQHAIAPLHARKQIFPLGAALRIAGADARTSCQEHGQNHEARRHTHIVNRKVLTSPEESANTRTIYSYTPFTNSVR